MMHKIMSLLFISNLTILFLTPSNIQASLEPPHDSSNNISCENCHAVVPGVLWGLLPRDDDQEAMCKSCHNPTGQASDMYMVANHVVNEGARIIDCGSCHNQHNPDNTIDPHSGIPAPNLKLIRSDTTKYVPEALEPAIYQLNPDHFSFDTAPYNGICQTCHTNTTYHRNDGAGLSHQPGAICTDCHRHEDGFSHGGGGGSGCGSATECHGLQDSHPTHVKSIADGGMLGIDCDACHDTNNFPLFSDGQSLSTTTVCDTCHSPLGNYDGIDDPGIGAKTNFENGVYNGSLLATGKEKWCAGCHDEAPSVIQGIPAPNVVGDEDAGEVEGYFYGTGYGFYKTGHGLDVGFYPASGAPAANLLCSDCHDLTMAHIDGIARTYNSGSDNYQAGYRLKNINSGPPMDIPRIDWNMPESDFALCFECHDSSLYLSDINMNTNFRDDSAGRNAHYRHLLYGGDQTDRWDSDWNSTGDSQPSCPACHNVHGSPSPRMVRHGELIGKSPVLNFFYYPDEYTALADSTGGWFDLAFGGGSIANSGVCVMCHSTQSGAYTREPKDIYPPKIYKIDGQVGSNVLAVVFSKGVYTNAGSAGDLIIGDFTLTDNDDGRSIVSISHTAGNDVAFLTLSSALDASGDIGIDTLAAASVSSIYDASDNAMGIYAVTITSDSDAPTISNLSPVNSETDVVIDRDLTFTLNDPGIGINEATLSIDLTAAGYSKNYTQADISIVSFTGPRSMYSVIINPDEDFPYGEVVTVTVNVNDLAGNSLTPPSWAFTVISSSSSQFMTIHPSGLNNQYESWTITNNWADDLDDRSITEPPINDNNPRATRCCTGGPTMYYFWVDMDDFSLPGATINNIVISVWARYRTVGGLDYPASGPVDVGYTTGGVNTWLGQTTTINGGDYVYTLIQHTVTEDDGGGPLDPTDIDNLQIGIERSTHDYELRVTEIAVEVEYIP